MRSSILMLPSMLLLLVAAGCSGGKESGQGGDSTGGSAANNKPVAEAGSPITQTADGAVTLNGSGSSDPDGDSLTYHWSFEYVPEGSTIQEREAPFARNHAADAITTTFTPDRVGTYVVNLMVRDSRGAESPTDFVVVTIEEASTLPVANAGTDQTVTVGATVNLDGTLSYDPQGRSLTYAWSFASSPTGSSASIASADAAAASFTADVKGTYVVNLVVSNGISSSIADAMTVTATQPGGPPVSNAGTDQSTTDCTWVNLDCSGSSDPDGDTLSYMWEVQSKPSGSAVSNSSFTDRYAAKPAFFPDVAGTYVVSCVVNDGTDWSTPDLVTVGASERPTNSKPSVDAGAAMAVDAGSAECSESGYSYACDECGSLSVAIGGSATVSDADNDPYTILWEVEEGSVTISDPTSLVTTVTLSDAEPTEPGDCDETDYKLKLTVTDCTGESTTDTLTITASCCGVADTAP